MAEEQNPIVNPPVDPQTPPPAPAQPSNDPPVNNSFDADLIRNPAVQVLVESARKQEKDKLYKTIEAEQEKGKTLAQKVKELEDQLAKREEGHMAEVNDLNQKVDGLQQQIGTLLESIEQEKSAREKEKAEADAKARAAELQAYRERKIREAGDELIMELVHGDSEEAIDASVETAKQKYQDIVSKVGKKETPAQRVANGSTRPTAPSNHQTPGLTIDQIRSMSREEYAKNRAAILKAAREGAIQ